MDMLLVRELTVTAKGEGEPVALGDAAGQRLLATLVITRVVEQESLDVSIWGSEDGADFNTRLAAFPQKFYTGTYQILVDLTQQPAIKYIRAKWETNRWGRGTLTPQFTFSAGVQRIANQASA